jgi:hypothetical protein
MAGGRVPKSRDEMPPRRSYVGNLVEWPWANEWQRNYVELPFRTEESPPGFPDPLWNYEGASTGAKATRAGIPLQRLEADDELIWPSQGMENEPFPIFHEFGRIPILASGNQPEASEETGVNQEDVPAWVTDQFKIMLAATILAEAGTNQKKMEQIGWIYFNNVMKEQGEKGLRVSAAHKKKDPWYRIWRYLLDKTYSKKVAPQKFYGKLPDDFHETEYRGKYVAEFCTKHATTRVHGPGHVKRAMEHVENMFHSPQTNPLVGWFNHGNVQDINGINSKTGERMGPKDALLWDRMRAYYWLQVEAEDKGEPIPRYVEVLASGPQTQMMFNDKAIEEYFKKHPEKAGEFGTRFEKAPPFSPNRPRQRTVPVQPPL